MTLLEGAIDRVTRAMLTASDDVIPVLVAERAAMRQELGDLRSEEAPRNVVPIRNRRDRI